MIFSPPRGAAAPRSPLPACAAARRPRERPARACSRRTRRPGAPPAGRRCRRRRPRRADERRARPAAPDRFVAAVPPRVQCAAVTTVAGAVVVRVETAWGRVVRAEQVEAALRSCRRPKVVALIHAETSTGAWQPLEDAVRLAHDHGALFLADCVTSLGGVPVEIDGWGIDAAYSGTQKCLSCPPGLAPLTFGARAVEALQRRKTPVQSWYLDLTLLQRYWGEERVYHHTAPISMNYALREAPRLVDEEGLQARYTRHRLNHEALAAGLGSLGLAFAAEEGHCLPMLNAVTVPEGVDEARVRRRLLEAHGIEVGGGLGPMKGRVWRIGVMG